MSTYKTKKIDELEAASELKDGCQIPICQDGTAKKLTGAQLKAYVEAIAKAQTNEEFGKIVVEAVTLEEGATPTVTSKVNETTHVLTITFGIPAGGGGGGGEGSSGVHVLDIGSEELDVTKLDLSAYAAGDVLVIIQNTEITQ